MTTMKMEHLYLLDTDARPVPSARSQNAKKAGYLIVMAGEKYTASSADAK